MITRAAIRKIVIITVITLVAAGLFFFIYRTYRAYLSGPSIVVSYPADYAAFSTSTVTIKGIAERIEDITLDGRSISVDDKGNFSETILLLPGYNIETLAGRDYFGHTTQKKLELVYNAPISSVTGTSTASTTSK